MGLIKFIKTYRTPILSTLLIAMMVFFFYAVVWKSLLSRDLWNYMFMAPGYFFLLGESLRAIKNMLWGIKEYGLDYLRWDEEES